MRSTLVGESCATSYERASLRAASTLQPAARAKEGERPDPSAPGAEDARWGQEAAASGPPAMRLSPRARKKRDICEYAHRESGLRPNDRWHHKNAHQNRRVSKICPYRCLAR